ncbi:MAG: hypothetical protein ACRDL1_12245, partial [Solirubrobacterales bacterium]
PRSAPATGRTTVASLEAGGLGLGGSDQGQNRRKGFTPPETRSAVATSSAAFPVWTLPAGIAILGLIVLAAAVAITTIRRFRYSRLSPAAAADAHLRELPLALARLGWPIKTNETLLALERRLARYRKEAAARYVAKLRAGRFSPAPEGDGTPRLADRRALRDDLVGRNGLRSRLGGLLALPPGGPSDNRRGATAPRPPSPPSDEG